MVTITVYKDYKFFYIIALRSNIVWVGEILLQYKTNYFFQQDMHNGFDIKMK